MLNKGTILTSVPGLGKQRLNYGKICRRYIDGNPFDLD